MHISGEVADYNDLNGDGNLDALDDVDPEHLEFLL
jgi:hypothetical protein